MNTEKTTTRMGSTTVTQTAEGFELKNGPGIKIPPDVTFKDVKNETVLGDPEQQAHHNRVHPQQVRRQHNLRP